MTYQEAKAIRAMKETVCAALAAELRAIPGVGSGVMGLTPDEVRATSRYQQARRAYDTAFSEMQAINRVIVRRFKAEMRAERNAKVPA